ncbi:CLL_collapsed_G0034640.mRNA.1.CDS.1 [Saccharomyces cerevisiae]|nr:CLL_HP2_G0029800.mRNA.1.CDS.1 [Saccharomyces cerevisiae]CAI6486687.1 CLL_HP1_G0015740.mRNA.1.CDS.1 [Saccharomyces cerevisiae]CAI6573382.1 CLL_HP2_G0029800.mRNA.1.CDS.1 [Saccharomyces cerevisiae]CAI6678292.1 CLL_HP1_G0034210.mRNA.1.CDS.1 [Saccharomyces cerevisiae]CAI7268116.1 CLL_collapsed_G0016000.mRNA.1.CDS.1 [Saccharomyces cerevisiae]
MTILSPSLPSITLPTHTHPVPFNHTTPTTIHLSTSYHQPIVHHNRYPPITHIQLHYHLPCHYPTIHHLLLTILLFYPPR